MSAVELGPIRYGKQASEPSWASSTSCSTTRSRCHPSPLPAVQRLLSPAVAGAEITEEFQLPLPLIEASPCEPADAEHAKAGEAKPVSILRLPVGWKRPDSVRKVIRVDGASDLSEIWGRDFGRVTVETRAPPAVALIPRSDPFTRF